MIPALKKSLSEILSERENLKYKIIREICKAETKSKWYGMDSTLGSED